MYILDYYDLLTMRPCRAGMALFLTLSRDGRLVINRETLTEFCKKANDNYIASVNTYLFSPQWCKDTFIMLTMIMLGIYNVFDREGNWNGKINWSEHSAPFRTYLMDTGTIAYYDNSPCAVTQALKSLSLERVITMCCEESARWNSGMPVLNLAA